MTESSFGSGVVQRLIPHRPPLLLVDRVDAFERAPRSLRACRHVSANDPIFVGHFPALAIYPGVFVLEGLAQAAAILRVLTELERKAEEAGRSGDDVLDALHNLELGHRLDPRFRPGWGEESLAKGPSIGFLAASEIKFKKPVFPGDVLTYSVALERELGALSRFRVEARVFDATVAVGTLTVARAESVMP